MLFKKQNKKIKDMINFTRSTSMFPSDTSFRTSTTHFLHQCPLSSRAAASSFMVNCLNKNDEITSRLSASDVLGVSPDSSLLEIKAAFRAKVKKFHPDVNTEGSDITIRRVIQAYEILSNYSRSEIIESWDVDVRFRKWSNSEFSANQRECLDPFDKPQCEALDVFVNELFCIGKGCPYSCVKKAPQAFAFSPLTGTARATSQGHGDDYQVQSAASQCPSNCIHYVTPSQRVILEELLNSIINVPYDASAEKELLYSLIVKAKFENNRYQKPKKQAKSSTKHVDWF